MVVVEHPHQVFEGKLLGHQRFVQLLGQYVAHSLFEFQRVHAVRRLEQSLRQRGYHLSDKPTVCRG
jgi:hypothetical protein